MTRSQNFKNDPLNPQGNSINYTSPGNTFFPEEESLSGKNWFLVSNFLLGDF